MIITIICLVLFVASIVWVEILVRDSQDGIYRAFHLLTTLLLIPLLIFAQIQITLNLDYDKKQYERSQLLEEYEGGNQFAYDDIIAFDKELKTIKYWGNNLWLNWFYNQRIVNEIDYILYEDS